MNQDVSDRIMNSLVVSGVRLSIMEDKVSQSRMEVGISRYVNKVLDKFGGTLESPRCENLW